MTIGFQPEELGTGVKQAEEQDLNPSAIEPCLFFLSDDLMAPFGFLLGASVKRKSQQWVKDFYPQHINTKVNLQDNFFFFAGLLI